MSEEILEIHGLSVSFRSKKEEVKAVDDISFTLKKGSTLAIVGESGSGKSVTALSVMRLLPPSQAHLSAEKMLLHSRDKVPVDLSKLPAKTMRNIRGNRISMIFQEPMSSLNPIMRCGRQVMEAIRAHSPCSAKEAKARTLDLFSEVMLPTPGDIFHAYPHELSGGQKQRVMIAMAIAGKPDILIADEPTTALDVTVQQNIIKLLKSLQVRYGMSMLFITHDLGLVPGMANEIIVMKEGKIVESGLVEEVFTNPSHPYTRQLLAARLSLQQPAERKRQFNTRQPLIKTEHLHVQFSRRGNKSKSHVIKAVDNVSVEVYPGEVLGLVGESGCGKTSLGRTMLRLLKPSSGKILYKEKELATLRGDTLKNLRKDAQIIFQDPYSSLNPVISIGKAIMEPMRVHDIGRDQKERKKVTLELLEKVGLGPQYFYRYPHELSGGQRQRVCIARALSVKPAFIVCDESVSALDLTVQAKILNLLQVLREEFQLTYVFISHDLTVVRFMSDRIAVMKDGKIMESAAAEEIFLSPKTEYTKRLIEAIPN